MFKCHVTHHMHQSWDQSCLKILRTVSSPQEYSPTGLNKLAGTSANIESWESSGILRNPQESCRNLWGTIKTSTGVGMCVCARHEIVCAGSVGDLQKGKWYVGHYQFTPESDIVVIDIVIWIIYCFLPSPCSLWQPFLSPMTLLASSS